MIFCVTGVPGAGKTLVTVGRIFDAIQAGKRIATNLDLNLEHLTFGTGATNVLRLSDFPTFAELEAIGCGNPTFAQPRQFHDESRNGLLVLDEASGYLNAREWNGNERKDFIHWLTLSRKHGWDIYFIVQSVNMLDKQVRDAVMEHVVVCRRLDRVPIPFVGWFIKTLGASGKFLRLHIGTVKLGGSAHALVVDRWFYRGNRFFAAYDTRQVFRADPSKAGAKVEPHLVPAIQGLYTVLDGFRAPWLRAPDLPWYVNALWRVVDRWKWLGPLAAWLPGRPSGPWCDFLLYQHQLARQGV